jgi:hypothetical protein
MRRTLLLFAIVACGHAEDFGGERPVPTRTVGATCGSDADCDQLCERGGRFPGGFCTLRCHSNPECPEGTVCINRDNGICMYPCATHSDCTSSFLGRGGYVCEYQQGFAEGDTESVSYQVCIGE